MSELLVEDRDTARWVTFNRPERLNTLMVEDLLAATEAVREAGAAGRTIVFTGAGQRAFCAGMNLDVFAGLVADPSLTRPHLGALHELLEATRTAEVATIAAINGHCLGAAFELALVCDFRLARPDALLGLPEIKLGLPCILDSALLSQHVGLAMAKDMMLTGRLHRSERLAELDVLTLVGDPAELVAGVDALTGELAASSAFGIAAQKRLFESWQNLPLAEANARSLDEIVAAFHDEGTRAAVRRYTAQLSQRPGAG